MIYELGEHHVTMAGEDYWIADNATVIGRVFIGHRVSIWYNVVIRADNDDVTIGDNTNIQDGSLLHLDPGMPIKIGCGCTIGHKVTLHSCEIGDHSLVGINAVILNGAKIGSHCLIGANALIVEGTVIPDGSLVVGVPGRVKRALTEMEQQNIELSAEFYAGHAELYRNSLRPDQRFLKSL